MNFIKKLLTISSTDPDQKRRSQLLNILLLGISGLAILTIMLTIFVPFEEVQEGTRLITAGTGFLASLIVIFVINRNGFNQLAGWLFVVLLTLAFAFGDTPEEVVFGRVLYLFTIPILISSVVIHSYSSFPTAILIGILINFIAINGLSRFNFVAPLGLLTVALVSWLAARSLEQALQDLRVTNEALEVRSAELEATNMRLREENAERRRAEEGLAEQARLLRRTNAELQQFAYVSTHDLREPLRKVRTYSELLERRYQGQLDERANKYIHYVVTGATQMQVLITDLLAYLSVGKKDMVCQATNMNEVLAKVLQNLAREVEEAYGRYHPHLSPHPPSRSHPNNTSAT